MEIVFLSPAKEELIDAISDTSGSGTALISVSFCTIMLFTVIEFFSSILYSPSRP
jgi:hypothetical protein